MKRPESIVTTERNNCILCGKRRKTEDHHLICGTSNRAISDTDALHIPVCDTCHDSIHRTAAAVALGKMLGQQTWEKEKILNGMDPEEVRDKFRERYGESWL